MSKLTQSLIKFTQNYGKDRCMELIESWQSDLESMLDYVGKKYSATLTAMYDELADAMITISRIPPENNKDDETAMDTLCRVAKDRGFYPDEYENWSDLVNAMFKPVEKEVTDTPLSEDDIVNWLSPYIDQDQELGASVIAELANNMVLMGVHTDDLLVEYIREGQDMVDTGNPEEMGPSDLVNDRHEVEILDEDNPQE